ncbi:MAG: hypothetical protein U5L74_12155 [Ideonella sp.]|nr:hypothetical protein [Ideonella sp.]
MTDPASFPTLSNLGWNLGSGNYFLTVVGQKPSDGAWYVGYGKSTAQIQNQGPGSEWFSEPNYTARRPHHRERRA